MENLNSTYSARISDGEVKIKRINKILVWLSVLRLSFFLLIFILPFYLIPKSLLLGIFSSVVFIALFLFSVKKYIEIRKQKKFEQFKVEINHNEKEALKHNFSRFYAGDEFINPNHINSYDLDLFGSGSLFQFLNRTVTNKGKSDLAEMLQTPILDVDKIKKRQLLVGEMTDELEWRQNFSAQGKMYVEDAKESELFEKLNKESFSLKSIAFTKLLLFVLPFISIVSIVFWVYENNSAFFQFSLILQVIFWLYHSKNIKLIYSFFGKSVNVLQKYGELLNYIEHFEWKSGEGKNLISKLKESGMPSVEIKKLRNIISSFDNRNNLLMGFILNLVFVWDVWHSYRLVQWHKRNKNNYKLWVESIAFVDALNSFANYSFNHKEYAFPDFSTDEFFIDAKQLGHPLIHPSKKIDNDFEFKNENGVMIVTGANMSGKSTFLRTVGVNMVLGMSGAPVCASEMIFKPVEVFSNMRTTDSLFDDESYFFAELKRIKAILDEVEKGKELLIILDEILKGTNSVDKLAGSQKLVQRLIKQKADAIIATHDLKLTEIENKFPKTVVNKCFEITIENDEMDFDYKLRDGVTTIMNATFLMKKMGIIE